ncbi:elongin-B-like [Lytechinus variegatus]|uniref:elongin-B-like n=2 Tax=Lytechinus TaxID=7652 RepID=UPI001BB29E5B|nr:elongin-B-like [Lytechinus variegatus]XP_054749207.1 elongin-B-like [Lytechinus pictus]
MDVFLMIKRQKTTIFTDAKETNTVFELKRIIEGITKKSPEDQQLYKDGDTLDDTKTLGDCGLTSNTAKAQAPAMLGLAFRECEGADFEQLNITPYSNPPELPDVMKPSDSTTNTVDQPVQ